MESVEPIRDVEKIEAMKKELLRSSQRDHLMFVIGINLGLRISDLLALKVGDVAGKDAYTLREEKTGKTRRVNLKAVRQAIADYTDGMSADAYLFTSRNSGSDGESRPIDRTQAYRILNDAARKVGIQDAIGTHTLRKTFGYHHYKKFKDVATLQEIFNHSSPSITKRYIGIRQDEIDETLNDFAL